MCSPISRRRLPLPLVLTLLTACSEAPPAPVLEVNFILPEDTSFLEEVGSYRTRVYYTGGDKTGILIEERFDSNGPDAAVLDGLAPTQEGEAISLRVEGFAENALQTSTTTALARARSGPLSLPSSGLYDVDLFLGHVGAFNSLETRLDAPRFGHTAVALDDGTVLLAGGMNDKGAALNSTLLFDDGYLSLSFGTLLEGGGMQSPRVHHSATLIHDEGSVDAGVKVLIAGGENGNRLTFVQSLDGIYVPSLDPDAPFSTSATVDVYDSSTGSLTIDNRLLEPRAFHEALELDTGRVLLCCGLTLTVSDETETVVPIIADTCETWQADPSSSTRFELPNPRVFHQMTQLETGQILITGGMSSAELDSEQFVLDGLTIDPNELAVTSVGRMNLPRVGHQAVTIPDADGKVLISGGYSRTRSPSGTGFTLNMADYSEIFDPSIGSGKPFSQGPKMKCPRAFHTAIPLPNGEILIVGGRGPTLGSKPPPEIYNYNDGAFRLVDQSQEGCGEADGAADGTEKGRSGEAEKGRSGEAEKGTLEETVRATTKGTVEETEGDEGTAFELPFAPLSDGSYLLSGGDWNPGAAPLETADHLVVYVPE